VNEIGVVAALPAEARTLTGRSQATGSLCHEFPGLLVSISGIGPTAADNAARRLVADGAGALISWGCGAGLAADVQPGQLVLPQIIIDVMQRRNFTVDSAWHQQLTNTLETAGMTLRTASLVSVAVPLTNRDIKQRLHRETGAIIADMESAAVAAVAHENNLPFLAVRAIADDLSVALPAEVLAILDARGRPSLPRLLVKLLWRPSLAIQLGRLGSAFYAAQKTLARVAAVTDKKLSH